MGIGDNHGLVEPGETMKRPVKYGSSNRTFCLPGGIGLVEGSRAMTWRGSSRPLAGSTSDAGDTWNGTCCCLTGSLSLDG